MINHIAVLEETIVKLTEAKKYASLRDFLTTLNPADIAEAFGAVSEQSLPLVFRLLPKELAAETFVEMETEQQEILIRGFSDSELKAVVELVEQLLGETHRKLAFVGDGITDAPVLARADIGIAMGALGSDAAIEAADIVLMDDKPSKIAVAIRISRKTMAIVRQNIIFALSVKFGVLLLGALGHADLWLAVFADVGVAFLAILNAMRMLY